MNALRAFLWILLVSISSTLTALSDEGDHGDSSVDFVPHGLLFRPLLANTYEPRVGLLSQFGKNRLRLDIGNSIDLLEYKTAEDGSRVSMGADFFTYTLLRGERDFHFPVDASDYFFGINFNYKSSKQFGLISSRLRISHISAHFVDGHYDNTKGEWKDSQYPIVYSREFVDAVLACQPALLDDALRGYLGATYLFHVDPSSVPPFMAYAGIEWHMLWSKNANSYVSFQSTLMKITEFGLRHNLQVGVKIGDWNGRGINLFANYFSGFSIHGEYFDLKENYFGLGFLIDF